MGNQVLTQDVILETTYWHANRFAVRVRWWSNRTHQRESGLLVKPRHPRGRAVAILVKARPCRVLLGLNLGELLREALDLVGERGNIVPEAAVGIWLQGSKWGLKEKLTQEATINCNEYWWFLLSQLNQDQPKIIYAEVRVAMLHMQNKNARIKAISQSPMLAPSRMSCILNYACKLNSQSIRCVGLPTCIPYSALFGPMLK